MTPTTAALGGLHFFIAFVIVVVYFLASGRAPVLTRHAVALGMAYGIVVYFAMSYIVIPLCATLFARAAREHQSR